MSASVAGNSIPAPAPGQAGVTNPTSTGSQTAFGSFLANGQSANGLSTAGQQIIAPGAGTSPYEYQNVIAAHGIILGPSIASALNLPNVGLDGQTIPYTGGQIMDAYENLSPSQLADLQELMYGAGFYANTAGEALNTRPVFGGFNIDSFNALSQLIIEGNNNPNTNLSDLITNRTQSGAGYYAQQNALQPILGGGNAYQVNLTNPQDVYAITYQIFEQYLGKAPTQAEYQSVLQGLQQQETQYQQAQNTQQEQMSQAKYQQQINSRTAENTPAAATGNVPNGPFQTAAQEAVAILQYAYPNLVTASNVEFLTAWIEQNGGVSNNPLNVSQVGGNASAAQGIQAAANLLKAPQYQALNAALQSGQAAQQAQNAGVQAELSQWSGGKITAPLNTKAQQAATWQAIMQVTPAQSTNTTPGMRPMGVSTNNMGMQGGGMGMFSGTPGAAPASPLNPSQPNTSGGLGAASPNSVPASQVSGEQGMSAPGDQYLAPTTLTNTEAPSAQNAATYAAMNVGGGMPFYANQALNVINTIMQMIDQPPVPKL